MKVRFPLRQLTLVEINQCATCYDNCNKSDIKEFLSEVHLYEHSFEARMTAKQKAKENNWRQHTLAAVNKGIDLAERNDMNLKHESMEKIQ